MPRIYPTIYPGLILPEVADALNEALADLGTMVQNIKATEPLYSIQDGGGVVIGLDLQSDAAMMAVPPGVTVENFGTIINQGQTFNYGEVFFYGPTIITNIIYPQCIPATWFETDVRCESSVLNVYRRNLVLYSVNGCPQISIGDWYFYVHLGTCTGPTGSPVTPTVPACQYIVSVSLNWLPGPLGVDLPPTEFYDFDLYVEDVTGGVVCYYGNLTAGALTLASGDCFPACAEAPIPPEVIQGTFTADNSFSVWYNQHGNCTVQSTQPPEQIVSVTNTGTANITYTMGGVTTVITPGQTRTFFDTPFAYAGYDTGDEHTYALGTPFDVACGGSPGGITTACCANAVPTTLHCTITDVAGCACLAGTYPLVYDGISAWKCTALVCTGGTLNLTLYCTGTGPTDWSLIIGDDPFEVPTRSSDAGSTCVPFVQNFTAVAYVMTHACTGSVTAVVTI